MKISLFTLLLLASFLWPVHSYAAKYHCDAACHRYLKSLNLQKLPIGCVVGHVTALKCGGTEENSNLMLYCGESSRRVAELREDAVCRNKGM